jgi:signal transduction histidine kinase
MVHEALAADTGMALEKDPLVGLRESILDLTEANRLKDDFVAMVSHELRTPMTVIQGAVKTLLRRELDLTRHDLDSLLKAIERNADRLQRIIEDLLIVSRIQSAGDGLEVSSMSLPSVVEQVCEELAQSDREHPIRVELGDDLPLTVTDESKVRQIVSNLLENACKYTPEGTPITLRGRVEADDLVISVQDEGPGIPEVLHERIFDRFFQVDGSSKRSVGGVGLGLYICRKLAEALGGRLSLERSDAHGSVFSLALPLVGGNGEAATGKRIGRRAEVRTSPEGKETLETWMGPVVSRSSVQVEHS